MEEFEKVVRVRRNTTEQTERVQKQASELLAHIGRQRFDVFIREIARRKPSDRRYLTRVVKLAAKEGQQVTQGALIAFSLKEMLTPGSTAKISVL